VNQKWVSVCVLIVHDHERETAKAEKVEFQIDSIYKKGEFQRLD